MLKSTLVIVAVVGAIVGEINGRTTSDRPSYIQCQSNLECTPGSCCTISPNRFSIAVCKPMLEEGEMCRPGSEVPVNRTLSYPGGSMVELTEVHDILCPCAYGLACDTGLCRDPSQKRDFNHLFTESSTQDD